MRVISLELASFRNYAALAFEPPGGACVLVGGNAQGKSNLLEALSLLAAGRSFRGARDADLIAAGLPAATVSARVSTRFGEVRASCTITRAGQGARKRFERNGRGVGYADFLGGVAAVTFEPSDLQLVGGPPQLRRRLLNAALSQLSRAYYRDLAAYVKALAQKNALLRSAKVDALLLQTYNEQLAEIGARIAYARSSFVRRLAREAGLAHARWVGRRQALTLAYRPVPAQPEETLASMEAALASALASAWPAEAARKVALIGPHRDDVQILLGGQPLARFGSQGQQRTAVLALKVAEYAIAQQTVGEAPLLLLDDVVSELDAARREAFLESIAGCEQAFITATELFDLPADLARFAFVVREGALSSLDARGRVRSA